jgi:hypothetical protein
MSIPYIVNEDGGEGEVEKEDEEIDKLFKG